jgi:cytosine/adenosine deaminase-related metal-dependent hydrolase
MRNVVFVLVLATVVVGTSVGSESSSLVFTNATVVDITTGHLLQGQTIVIIGDRITGLSPKVGIPAHAEVVNTAGKFVVPGFWDMHAHALWSTDQVQRMFDLFLANGITAIRDMGSPLPVDETLQWRRRVATGAILGPRIFAAGKIVDGPRPVWPDSVAVQTEQQARETVDDLHNHGVDFIKVYSRLPREAYFAVAAEAKKVGMAYVGHVPIYISPKEASVAGQRSIEHLSEILFACSSDESNLRKQLIATAIGAERDRVRKDQLKVVVNTFDEEKAAQLSRLFAKNDTRQVPTLLVQYTYAFMDPSELHDWPRAKYVPARAVTGWIDRLGSFRKMRDEEDMKVQKRSYELETQVARMMRRDGVHFMTGTDAETFYPAGFGLHAELSLFVRAGFSPLETLQAATLNPAVYFERSADFGTVEVGKIADLVLLEANPLEDIRNAERIAGVVRAGRYLDRHELDRLLSEAADLASRAVDVPRQ